MRHEVSCPDTGRKDFVYETTFIVWDWNSPYCEGGRLAQGPEDLFDLLLEDCQSHYELELTKGRRELTAEDVKQASAKCRPYLEKRWEVEKK